VLLLCWQAAPSDPEWQEQEERHLRRSQERCTEVIQSQGSHSMALQRLASHHLQQRSQLVSLLLEQGLQLGLPCDVVQDAVHLADCAAEGGKAGPSSAGSSMAAAGAWPEHQLPAVAVALLRTAAQAAGTAVPSMAAASEKVHVDMGQLLDVERRLAAQLSDADFSSSSAGVMRCLQVYVEVLGGG
jgi:hypothetical protein